MIHLDFYQEQENSLDILIQFKDAQQQPQPITHQQCFLPVTQISVTSHHQSYAEDGQDLQLTHQQHKITQEIITKMMAATAQQESKLNELLARNGRYQQLLPILPKKKGSQEIQGEGKGTNSKRKIIRKINRQ